ncbi:protein FAM182B-like isoform X1 [Trachypithecus francoisi]|uniref:protein FAM182B-like isoform X1 n=1 Tax=Trachypithecus francoisi TaxID=54180 RepID=UPI00141B120F|nr:protein FAM182B-like isoform X1 [Trachypithecus francoisi]
MWKAQAGSGGSSAASQAQARPDAVWESWQRADQDVESTGGVQGKQRRIPGSGPPGRCLVSFDFSCFKTVREPWMWNVEEEEHELGVCTWSALRVPRKGTTVPYPRGVSEPQSASQLMMKLLAWQKSLHKLWKVSAAFSVAVYPC